LSFDAGDLKTPAFTVLNPRQKVPVIVDNDFALSESAAIVEYLEDKEPREPRLFSADLRERAQQRRMIREIDEYFATPLEELAEAVLFTPPEEQSEEEIATADADLRKELATWEAAITGDYLAGALSAVDFTLYPYVALLARMGKRKPGLPGVDPATPRLKAWMDRMTALPMAQKTWPPHWK
jgi:glutathione S-transferase